VVVFEGDQVAEGLGEAPRLQERRPVRTGHRRTPPTLAGLVRRDGTFRPLGWPVTDHPRLIR
jgi:hypothetical protein